MTQYPRDEFDQVPESAARQGVHRERLVPPRSSGLALKVLAGLLVLAVGLAAYFLFPRLGIGQASSVTPETGSAAPMPSITADDDAGGSPDGEPSQAPTPSASERPTPSVQSSPGAEPGEDMSKNEPEPAATVDRTQPVAVLNATTVSGLASTAAGRLQGDGWNVTRIGNWSGEQLQGSIVLYNSEEQRITAEALAGALGIVAVQGNAGFSGEITVVVGPGFQ